MLILEKNIFEQFVAKFFENIEIISGVIIPIAADSKTFYYHYLFIYLFIYFCNIARYDRAKFYVKSVLLLRFMQGA